MNKFKYSTINILIKNIVLKNKFLYESTHKAIIIYFSLS